MNNDYEIECENCGWSGRSDELVALTEDLKDCDFSYRPDCSSQDIIDIDQDE